MKKYDGRNCPKKSKKDVKDDTKKPAKVDNLCLFRARIGEKKISTVLQQKDLNRFQLAYSNLLRGNMYGLSKRKE